jgi:hypothetical protein
MDSAGHKRERHGCASTSGQPDEVIPLRVLGWTLGVTENWALYEMCDLAIATLTGDVARDGVGEGMDDQARVIGQRVRYWRLRRNLGRQQFADMVGRSTSWLDKVEKGERSLLRLPMLDRVASQHSTLTPVC